MHISVYYIYVGVLRYLYMYFSIKRNQPWEVSVVLMVFGIWDKLVFSGFRWVSVISVDFRYSVEPIRILLL